MHAPHARRHHKTTLYMWAALAAMFVVTSVAPVLGK